MAAQLHPNNVRKVRRALIEAIKQGQQFNEPADLNNPSFIGLSNRSCQPRFPGQTYIFWMDCDKDVLDGWLDRRVDGMVKAGLVDELDRFINSFLSSGTGKLSESAKNHFLALPLWSSRVRNSFKARSYLYCVSKSHCLMSPSFITIGLSVSQLATL